jgi:hypothetical protein
MVKMNFICPYCFDQHKITEAQFRCTNKRCKQVPDIEMTKYLKGDEKTPRSGGKTFPAPSNIQYTGDRLPNANCPECGKKTHSVVCPSCHNNLPESTLEGKDMIISIVGSADTGKSHFVGVIIKELIERISVKFGGSMTGWDDTMTRYQVSFERNLYTDLQKLDMTKSSLSNVDNGAYKPLIYKLSFPHKNWYGKNMINSFTFVFFDTAGEDLRDEDTMSTVNKYICNSSGIIFLLDPIQIPAVRNQLDAETIARASTRDWRLATRSDDIMTRVSRLIRNNNNLPSTQKIDIPVAAVFSKFDAIYSIIPKGCTVLETSPHCAKKSLFLPDWHNVNSEVQGLLKTWGADSFMSQLDVNYTNYSYFAVSALGLNNNPRKDRGIDKPRPHRIEDPLLWLWMKNGVIKTSTK